MSGGAGLRIQSVTERRVASEQTICEIDLRYSYVGPRLNAPVREWTSKRQENL